jgi:hypothetical protein
MRILWIVEKDHSPQEFGTLECIEGRLSPAPPLLAAQATAFIRSYLARVSKQQSLIAGAAG